MMTTEKIPSSDAVKSAAVLIKLSLSKTEILQIATNLFSGKLTRETPGMPNLAKINSNKIFYSTSNGRHASSADPVEFTELLKTSLGVLVDELEQETVCFIEEN